jgi:phosphatidate cytidylyltransferase
MLRTRLWMGALLIGLAIVLLLEERWFAPWYPILYCTYFIASLLATRELLGLLPEDSRPCEWLTITGVLLITAGDWWPALQESWGLDSWDVIGIFALAVMIFAFLREMWLFTGPNKVVMRLALTAFTLFYLGVLPSFLVQLRWLSGDRSTVAIALAVFVPKGNDIGAYFTGKFLTGRLLGRTPMTPLLSPKKTWQGAVGGMLASVGVACGIQSMYPIIPHGWVGTVCFGLSVGVAGMLGDLAESLIKRDLKTKDASKSVPGFGGVLDVIDSLLFAGTVAYLWFRLA